MRVGRNESAKVGGMNTISHPQAQAVAVHSFWRGFWRLADPKISLASIASMFLGACAAAAAGPLHLGWLACTVIGILAIEIAKNASGELFDYDSGTDLAVESIDRSPFSGGKRVLVDGLLTRGETRHIAVAGYAVGIGTGLMIVSVHGWVIFWIGLVGVACALFYHAPPVQLAYRGLGEIAVALCYGPLIATGTFYVQRGTMSPALLWTSMPLGLLIGAFLLINEFPDSKADQRAGKRTLVVRYGRRKASIGFGLLMLMAFLTAGLLPLAGVPMGVLTGCVAAIPGFRASQILRRHHEVTRMMIPAQTQTLLTFVLYALSAGMGWLVLR